jgi:hypothetical protein
MDNQGTHPGRDLLLLFRFYSLLRRERPDVYLSYTVKPNVYEREAMGALGRNKVERDFDEQIVIKKYLDTIKLALGG